MSKGKIVGISEGRACTSCLELSQKKIHQYQNPTGLSKTAPGIVTDKDGIASSVLLNGGYSDDEDYLNRIIYTGSGGQDENKRIQIADQVTEGKAGRNNLGLINAYLNESPLRVIRGFKHKSKYSPKRGYRYDGIHFIKRYWWTESIHGPLVIRFELIHEDKYSGRVEII